jgi:hypothetical protein
MFKLRPYRGLLVMALLATVIGGLISAYFLAEDAYCAGSRRGVLAVIVTLVLAVLLVIAAFSRYGFSHLRHHRPGYKRG